MMFTFLQVGTVLDPIVIEDASVTDDLSTSLYTESALHHASLIDLSGVTMVPESTSLKTLQSDSLDTPPSPDVFAEDFQ